MHPFYYSSNNTIRTSIYYKDLFFLSDDETIRFYPSMFFQLSDLITYFGYLVYDRLVTKCPDLKVNFTFSDVGPQARELCKNWLYKIASIRGKIILTWFY